MTNHIEIDHEADTEQYDEIPWSHLVEELGRPRRNIPLLVAGVLLVGGLLGFLASRMIPGPAPTSPAPPSTPVATVAVSGPDEGATVATTLVTSTTSAPPADVLFSEADLMAVASDLELTTAATRAEWFVREYFTVDTSSGAGDQVQKILDAFEVDRPDAVSYVEWARASTVEPAAPGEYAVTVVFQLLVADGEAFVRHRARAVRVVVGVDPTLASAVKTLPEPALLPNAAVALPAVGDDPAPAEVLEEATVRALRFGSEPDIVRSWSEAGTWHIVMSVHHGGAAWPLLIEVPQPGSSP